MGHRIGKRIVVILSVGDNPFSPDRGAPLPPQPQHEGQQPVTTLKVSDRIAAELKGDALVLVSIQTDKGLRWRQVTDLVTRPSPTSSPRC